MNNLVNSLVIAVINPDYYGRKVFAMFYVQEQNKSLLKVLPVWDMDSPLSIKGKLNGCRNNVRELKMEDIWVFPTSLTKIQEESFKKDGLYCHFHKDENALGRLALKLGMDKTFIGFEGESDNGTWFTCCRTEKNITNILPENFHIYSLRSSDEDDAQPASIEEKVVVNHYGDILTDKALPVPVILKVEHIEYDEEDNIVSE